jgi:hypothetical protein
MQFILPSNLQIELLDYDPTLKKLARDAKLKAKSNKPKFPLGQPIDIIPEDVLRTSLVQDAIDIINGNSVEQRVHEVKRLDGFTKTITCAILYHYQSCWYAAWLPPKGKEQDYVYGYAFVYKDTKQARDMVPYQVHTQENKEDVTYGRCKFIRYSHLVTKQDIIDNKDTRRHWNLASVSWGKGANIRDVLKNFEEALKNTIPTWDDSRNMFERLIDSSFVKVLELERVIDKELKAIWKPSVDNLFKIIDQSVLFPSDYHFTLYRDFKYIRHIIDKPFFRKWIQARCDEVISRLDDQDNRSSAYASAPWEQIKALFINISYVHSIWPECPIDYYQTHLDNLLTICNLRTCSDELVKAWLNKHMPVASFFSIIEKHIQQEANSNTTYSLASSRTGMKRYWISDWNDTVNMLGNVLEDRQSKGETLAPPKRWRIDEFHDYVQAEAWKVKHVNNSLPQDLFPEPIKVQYENQTWTFIQPIDTHQLAAWGQAVRNCVGNASNYADGVRKKKHFIVLAMLDSKPTFTIQLEVDMGMMSVKQIVGVSNSRLDDQQRHDYTESFRLALKLQESKLQSA